MDDTKKLEICKELLIVCPRCKNIRGLCLAIQNEQGGYNVFSYSTQLSTKFQLLIKLKYRKMKKSLALSLSDVVLIKLISFERRELEINYFLLAYIIISR